MPKNIRLVLKMTYDTGRESRERHKSTKRVSSVRTHWFSHTGRAGPKMRATDLKISEELNE